MQGTLKASAQGFIQQHNMQDYERQYPPARA